MSQANQRGITAITFSESMGFPLLVLAFTGRISAWQTQFSQMQNDDYIHIGV